MRGDADNGTFAVLARYRTHCLDNKYHISYVIHPFSTQVFHLQLSATISASDDRVMHSHNSHHNTSHIER